MKEAIQKANRDELVYALALMYEQYCAKDGHLFMSAGEMACELLEREGVLKGEDGTGRGEIDFTSLEEKMI